MWVKWVGGMWDLLTIYGKNEVRLLIGDRLKWKSVTLNRGRREYLRWLYLRFGLPPCSHRTRLRMPKAAIQGHLILRGWLHAFVPSWSIMLNNMPCIITNLYFLQPITNKPLIKLVMEFMAYFNRATQTRGSLQIYNLPNSLRL